MMSRFDRWQCSENPKHRGWREINEPRGTCDFCLAVTRWEQEAEDSGEAELAPAHLLPENRWRGRAELTPRGPSGDPDSEKKTCG